MYNNSLIVESGDRNTYVSYEDIYEYSYSSDYSSYDVSFAGESSLTSAIDYVVTEEFPQLYVLEGHGEPDLPDSFREQIEKDNIEINTLSLLTVDEIPEEADCIMIYAPATDISQEEKEMLASYTQNGGKLLVLAGPSKESSLDNLNTCSPTTAWRPVRASR